MSLTNALAKPCTDCRHYAPGTVFDLCKREESRYSVGGKVDFHTIGHMRDERRGPCGPSRNLFTPL